MEEGGGARSYLYQGNCVRMRVLKEGIIVVDIQDCNRNQSGTRTTVRQSSSGDICLQRQDIGSI